MRIRQMRMHDGKLIVGLFALAPLMLLGACNSAGENHSDQPIAVVEKSAPALEKSSASQRATVKPGANIGFSHDYDGKTQVGESERITITLTPEQGQAQLSVVVQPEPGIELLDTDEEWRFELPQPKPPQVAIEVLAQQAGRYYVNLIVTQISTQGQSQTRAFGLAIPVGQTADQEKTSVSQSDAESADVNDGMVVLPVQETVR